MYTVNRLRSSVPLTSCFRPPSGSVSAAGTFLKEDGLKTFACPYFGQGAEAYNGKVTMRDAHGNVKTVECVKWRDETCDMCRAEEVKDESEGKPGELHERK